MRELQLDELDDWEPPIKLRSSSPNAGLPDNTMTPDKWPLTYVAVFQQGLPRPNLHWNFDLLDGDEVWLEVSQQLQLNLPRAFPLLKHPILPITLAAPALVLVNFFLDFIEHLTCYQLRTLQSSSPDFPWEWFVLLSDCAMLRSRPL